MSKVWLQSCKLVGVLQLAGKLVRLVSPESPFLLLVPRRLVLVLVLVVALLLPILQVLTVLVEAVRSLLKRRCCCRSCSLFKKRDSTMVTLLSQSCVHSRKFCQSFKRQVFNCTTPYCTVATRQKIHLRCYVGVVARYCSSFLLLLRLRRNLLLY
jgi:hypothetical protein